MLQSACSVIHLVSRVRISCRAVLVSSPRGEYTQLNYVMGMNLTNMSIDQIQLMKKDVVLLLQVYEGLSINIGPGSRRSIPVTNFLGT